MSENELRRILQAHPAAQLEEYPAPDFKVQIANGNIVPVRKQVLLRFFIGGKIFEETFMILPTMGNILIGMSFFKKYSVTLDLANNIVRFPEITLQLKPPNGKFKLQMLELRTTQKTTISPGQQIFVTVTTDKDIGKVTGTIEAFPAFERKTELLVSTSMSEIKDQQTHVQITNHMDHAVTIPQNSTIAVFRILTPNQARNIQPMTNEQLALITKFPDEAANVINQLFQDPSATNDKRWYPTPETCDDPDKLKDVSTTNSSNSEKLKNSTRHAMTNNAKRSSKISAGTTRSSLSTSNRGSKNCSSNITRYLLDIVLISASTPISRSS